MGILLNILLTGVAAGLYASDPNPLKLGCLVITAACLVWSLVIAARRS